MTCTVGLYSFLISHFTKCIFRKLDLILLDTKLLLYLCLIVYSFFLSHIKMIHQIFIGKTAFSCHPFLTIRDQNSEQSFF